MQITNSVSFHSLIIDLEKFIPLEKNVIISRNFHLQFIYLNLIVNNFKFSFDITFFNKLKYNPIIPYLIIKCENYILDY